MGQGKLCLRHLIRPLGEAKSAGRAWI